MVIDHGECTVIAHDLLFGGSSMSHRGILRKYSTRGFPSLLKDITRTQKGLMTLQSGDAYFFATHEPIALAMTENFDEINEDSVGGQSLEQPAIVNEPVNSGHNADATPDATADMVGGEISEASVQTDDSGSIRASITLGDLMNGELPDKCKNLTIRMRQ